MSTPLQGTASSFNISKVNYTHDAVISMIIATPWITQREIARHFHYTEAWISQVMGSDAFQARLAARKSELEDPAIIATIEERFKGLANLSMNVLQEKLEASRSAELALKTLELATRGMGYGARQAAVNQQVNFVVQVPGKAATEEEWSKAYNPKPAINGEILESKVG
jgi:hypothetical protein